ncbi:hypothetical protein ACHAQA_009237 [Verticillium albo-atrum]
MLRQQIRLSLDAFENKSHSPDPQRPPAQRLHWLLAQWISASTYSHPGCPFLLYLLTPKPGPDSQAIIPSDTLRVQCLTEVSKTLDLGLFFTTIEWSVSTLAENENKLIPHVWTRLQDYDTSRLAGSDSSQWISANLAVITDLEGTPQAGQVNVDDELPECILHTDPFPGSPQFVETFNTDRDSATLQKAHVASEAPKTRQMLSLVKASIINGHGMFEDFQEGLLELVQSMPTFRERHAAISFLFPLPSVLPHAAKDFAMKAAQFNLYLRPMAASFSPQHDTWAAVLGPEDGAALADFAITYGTLDPNVPEIDHPLLYHNLVQFAIDQRAIPSFILGFVFKLLSYAESNPTKAECIKLAYAQLAGHTMPSLNMADLEGFMTAADGEEQMRSLCGRAFEQPYSPPNMRINHDLVSHEVLTGIFTMLDRLGMHAQLDTFAVSIARDATGIDKAQYVRLWVPFLVCLTCAIAPDAPMPRSTGVRTMYREMLSEYLKAVVGFFPSYEGLGSPEMKDCKDCSTCSRLRSWFLATNEVSLRANFEIWERDHAREVLEGVAVSFEEQSGQAEATLTVIVKTAMLAAYQVTVDVWKKRALEAQALLSSPGFNAAVLMTLLGDQYDAITQMTILRSSSQSTAPKTHRAGSEHKTQSKRDLPWVEPFTFGQAQVGSQALLAGGHPPDSRNHQTRSQDSRPASRTHSPQQLDSSLRQSSYDKAQRKGPNSLRLDAKPPAPEWYTAHDGQSPEQTFPSPVPEHAFLLRTPTAPGPVRLSSFPSPTLSSTKSPSPNPDALLYIGTAPASPISQTLGLPD